MLEVKLFDEDRKEYGLYFNGELLPNIKTITIESSAGDLTAVHATFIVAPREDSKVVIRGSHD